MRWNDDWRTELKEKDESCYIRLCECRNTRKDLLTMSKLVYKYNPTIDAEECLIHILEWVGDLNNQFGVTDLTREEYNNMIYSIENNKIK